ncbi:MAG: restriction endonuclease subunit S [Clostridium sp.]
MEKRKIPAVRFKGFEDDWEQCKLSDVLDDMYNGQTPSRNKSEYWNGNIKWLSSGELNRGTVYDSIEMITEDGQKSANLRIVPKGTFIMAITGLEAAGTRGNCALLGFDTTLNQSCMALFPKKDLLTSDFLSQWYRKVGEEYGLNYTQGTKQQSYNAELIKILPISLPLVTEQKKIASYLSNLDHLITLHQRKLEKLQLVKKSMLEKMFPKNGSKIPEIRFEGFADDWEQCKLNDVAKFSKGNGYSKGDLIEAGTPIILYGRLYTKYETTISDVDTFVVAKDGSVYSKGGEVIVPASGETAEDIARAATVDKPGILLGGDLNVVMPNEEINSAFLAISISNGSSQRELAKKAQGKSVVHIHNEEIRNLVVPFPTKAEQNKIVDYFANLDSLITLHQSKLKSLKFIYTFFLGNSVSWVKSLMICTMDKLHREIKVNIGTEI